jgi:chromosome partitioning protein
LASAVGRELILRDELAEDNFPLDYLFIDCPPSLGLFTMNALTAVQEVFVPLLPHYLSMDGFTRLVGSMEGIAKRLNKSLRLSGIFFTQFDGTRLANEILQDVTAFFEQRDSFPAIYRDAIVFETKIRKNIRLAEAPSHGCPIFKYDSNSSGAEDYHNLAAEIIEKFGAVGNKE